MHTRKTNKNFKPPNQHVTSREHLHANYAAYQVDQLTKLLLNVETFDLEIFDDGATIVKVSIIDILACSAGNSSCILDVVDCLIMLLMEIRRMHFIFVSR